MSRSHARLKRQTELAILIVIFHPSKNPYCELEVYYNTPTASQADRGVKSWLTLQITFEIYQLYEEVQRVGTLLKTEKQLNGMIMKISIRTDPAWELRHKT